MISTRSARLVIDTVVCLTLAKWETVSGRFGGYLSMSLTLAQQCRGSCREWAPTSLAENKCMICFQTVIACSTSQEPPDSQGNDIPYAAHSKDCLSALAGCTANCRGQTASGTPR